MSVRIELSDLAAATKRQAGFAYLLTVAEDARAHAVALVPRLEGTAFVCDVGATTARYASARPQVSLLWPPAARGECSLIVDGDATVAGGVCRVVPTGAVQHRPAE